MTARRRALRGLLAPLTRVSVAGAGVCHCPFSTFSSNSGLYTYCSPAGGCAGASAGASAGAGAGRSGSGAGAGAGRSGSGAGAGAGRLLPPLA
ncbi:hypothetical protein C3B44_03650 [Corynebacterium yudongzhengii]|nr:hypothetical protein C3B44_03650 [Corynebacterium yudongzhengii]